MSTLEQFLDHRTDEARGATESVCNDEHAQARG
jgi:hypothetical protein